MNYIPNSNASGWRAFLSGWYHKIADKCSYVQQKLISKTRLARINNRLNGLVVLAIALTMLLSMLFSISLIIIVGVSLFIINAGWYSFTSIFNRRAKQKLS